MARYRKIEQRMWADAKFRALSPIPPCGQGLWVWLVAGPHTGPIPGVLTIGEAGMAERLGWPLEAFREAFREALGLGMVRADLEAPIVWLPRAIHHNPPQSPNVVRSWSDAWQEVPECDLKVTVYKYLKAFAEGMDKAFAIAFHEAIEKPFAKPLANQEQEQEQEQNEELLIAAPAAIAPTNGSPPDHSEGFERWWKSYPRKVGKVKAEKAWRKLRKERVLPETAVVLAATIAQAKSTGWREQGGKFIPHPTTWLNRGGWDDEIAQGRIIGAYGSGHDPRDDGF